MVFRLVTLFWSHIVLWHFQINLASYEYLQATTSKFLTIDAFLAYIVKNIFNLR